MPPRPSYLETLAIVYALGGLVLGLLFGAPVGGYVLTVVLLTAALILVAFSLVRLLGVPRDLARLLAGVTLTFVIYAALPPILDLRRDAVVDGQLWALERVLLGTTAVELLEPYVSDGLTVLFAAVYSLHAPLFFIPALLHWLAGRRERAERLTLALALAMYFGFLGYAAWPALGPVGTFQNLRPLTSNLAMEVVATYGVALGTFPSLHAGICSIVAMDAWRTSRLWGAVATVLAVAIWLSTLYLRYHWVPDLFAGLMLALLCYWLSGKIPPEQEVKGCSQGRSRAAIS